MKKNRNKAEMRFSRKNLRK